MPRTQGNQEETGGELGALEAAYADPVWASALEKHATQKRLSLAQRGVAMRIISAYRTVVRRAILSFLEMKKSH